MRYVLSSFYVLENSCKTETTHGPVETIGFNESMIASHMFHCLSKTILSQSRKLVCIIIISVVGKRVGIGHQRFPEHSWKWSFMKRPMMTLRDLFGRTTSLPFTEKISLSLTRRKKINGFPVCHSLVHFHSHWYRFLRDGIKTRM